MPIEPTQPLFDVPHSQNRHFIGREQFLADLHDALAQKGRHIQVIYGLAGVGKSQVAVEYAYRYRDRYRIVFWLSGEESATVWVEFAQLARELGVVEGRELSLETIRQILREHLAQRDDFLLIFDNATSPASICDFIPSPCRGHVLVTSRNPNWSGLARSTALHGLTREESVQFLRRRTGRMDSESAAAKLAQALGDLPLALEQAAAVIAQSRISFADYLKRFEDHWAELLTAQTPGGDCPDSVAMTWELSLREVEAENPDAVTLLTLLSFLAIDQIERRLLERHFVVLPDELSMLVADSLRLDRALEVLARMSLIEVHGQPPMNQTVSLHRLVAALARARLDEDRRRFWAGNASRLVSEAFGFDSTDPTTWAPAGAVLPHAMAAALHAQATGVPVEITCGLLDRAGRYLNRFGQYEQAKPLLDRALAISRRAYGDDSPRVSQAANNLGRVLARLGHHEHAREHFERALEIDRGTYGDSDPHVASVMNNYAMVLHACGRLDEARRHFEHALGVFEHHYGPHHPKVATLLNNLGYLHLSSGDALSSIDFFNRALAIAESTLGPAHPTAGAILHNLGTALARTGQPAEARDRLERALSIAVGAYGENHPDVARDCTALAALLRANSEEARADEYERRAAAIRASLSAGAGAASELLGVDEG